MRMTIKDLRLFAGGQADVFLRQTNGETLPLVLPKGRRPPGDGWEPFERFLQPDSKTINGPTRDW